MEGDTGPAAEEILGAVRRGTETSLILQAPDGQAPSNGRTDNHVFNYEGKVTAVEADREVVLELNVREYTLAPCEPVYLD